MREAALPPGLRFLKWLVILLTLTMIVGVITIVAVLVTRIPQTFGRTALPLPPALTLPDGLHAQAVTLGRDWTAVVASDAAGGERILIFGPDGTLRQEVPIAP
jgi:Family of unknown function (DUF6476)